MLNITVLILSILFDEAVLKKVPIKGILYYWVGFMILVALLGQFIIGTIFYNIENEKAGGRASKIARILHYEN